MLTRKLTVAFCKEMLSAKGFSGGPIYFEGRYLGRFVTHGHHSGNGKSVYASRITAPFHIMVTASNRQSMLNKVASELAKGAKEKGISIDAIGSTEH